MLRDLREDGVTREQERIELDGALRDVGVRKTHIDAHSPECPSKFADVQPVTEGRDVKWRVLQQLAESKSLVWQHVAAEHLRYGERRQY